MVTAHDVAAYVLQQSGPMRAMKLEKDVYYSQAWNLGWHNEPLFHDPIQAFVKAPIGGVLGIVIGAWMWSANGTVTGAAFISLAVIIIRVLLFYGSLTGDELSC